MNLDGQEPEAGGGMRDVPDAEEMKPGVKLVNGETKVLITDPWPNESLQGYGTFTLAWQNPIGKTLQLNAKDSPITVSCHATWPSTFTVTRSENWVDYVDSVVVALVHSESTEVDQVRLGLLPEVDIVLTNEYPTIPISPVYDNTQGKKWVIATFPEPDQVNVDWDVQLLGLKNANANVKYQRGTSAEANVGWKGATENLFFTNGRSRKPQLTNDCFPDSGLSSVIYTNFQATHPNLLQVDIPSARSIGYYPEDFEHWHMGLEVSSMPTNIVSKSSILENTAGQETTTFTEFQNKPHPQNRWVDSGSGSPLIV